MSELSGDALRAAVFDAVAADDSAKFTELCTQHEAAIVAAFGAWRTVPPTFRTPDKIGWYSRGLITIASYFAQHRGNPALRALLVGEVDDNPVVKWERALRDADPMMTALEFERAADVLRPVLAEGERLQGNAVERYLPITCGKLGECLFQLGNPEAAAHLTARALSLSQTNGDRDGQRVYLGNLAEIERYRGKGGRAAEYYDQLAALVASDGRHATEIAHYRRRAAIARAGEPACRVVAEVDGWRFEIDELVATPPQSHMRFHFERDRIALRRSTAAVQAGMDAGSRGEPEAALRQFEAAAVADPHDPAPHYQAGLALLELGRFGDAADAYARTEARAPGWFHVRADRRLAEQLAAGALDREVVTAVRRLEDPRLPPDQAIALADAARTRHPLPALDLAIGHALRRLGRDDDARAAYRRGLDSDRALGTEPDIRSRLLVALGGVVTGDERHALLTEAIALPGNLIAAVMARLILAAQPAADAN